MENETTEIRMSAVKKIIIRETESKFKEWEQKVGLWMMNDDEWVNMKADHIQKIQDLPCTQKAVDDWLLENRRVTLRDWSWSL